VGGGVRWPLRAGSGEAEGGRRGADRREHCKRAITDPLRMIAENADEEGAIVLGKINNSKDNNFGYNALTGDYEDIVKAGVLDPTKVVRTALTKRARSRRCCRPRKRW
jgi:chaperonin GroEL (HSP60 family)